MDSMNRKFFQRIFCRSEYSKLEGQDVPDLYPSSKVFVPHKLPQYLAALTANIGAFGLGNALGWTSPSLPNIEDRGDLSNLRANSELATWVGAMTPLGCFLSGLAAGFLIEKIGRKRTMLAMAPPFVAGWLMIAFAPSVPWVLVGRLITGFCGGAFTLVVPVYASEIAQDSERGVLCNVMGPAINSGILFIYVVGTFVPWYTSSIISAFLPAIFAVAMLFMPETPLYLLSKGKSTQAQKSLIWLRGADSHEDIAEELICVNKILAPNPEGVCSFGGVLIEASMENSNSDSATLKELMKPSVLKPALICLMLMLFQQFGGINGVTFYSVDIFKDAGTNINDNLSAIILGIVQVVFGFVSTVCVERLGRRILLTVSELGLTVSLLALGTYFYIKAENPESAAYLGWLPLTSLIVYVMSFNFGVGPVPWTLMGELPPAHAKGFVSSLTTAFSWGLGFIITKFFKDMITTFTAYGCYWLFGVISFAGLVYCIMFVPETKGKSALEIKRNFESGRVKSIFSK